MDNLLIIAASEARSACAGEPDLTERVRKAMRVTRSHWLVTGYEDRFKTALAGAMLESPEDERAQLQAEFDALAKMSAVISAARVGLSVDGPIDVPEKIVGLRRLWLEIAGPP